MPISSRVENTSVSPKVLIPYLSRGTGDLIKLWVLSERDGRCVCLGGLLKTCSGGLSTVLVAI
jgi:hypothetical protein